MLLNVILTLGWFFLILSKTSVGSANGSITRRFSDFDSGPPPILDKEEAILRSREAAIVTARKEETVRQDQGGFVCKVVGLLVGEDC